MGDLHHNSERKVLVELEVAPSGAGGGIGGWGGGYPAPAVPVGMVGAGSTADPSGPHVGQTAMVIIP